MDKTANDADNVVEFDEFAPVECRYVKLTITGWPKDVPLGVIEFTVFGKPGSVHPGKTPKKYGFTKPPEPPRPQR